MEVMKLSKLVWAYISGVYLPENGSVVFGVLLNVVHVVCFGVCGIGNIVYCYYEWNNLTVAHTMVVILQISSNCVLINYIIYSGRKKELATLVEKFQQIVNKRYNAFTAEIYEEAEGKSERISKWPFVFYLALYEVGFAICTSVFYIISFYQDEVNVYTWPNLVHIKMPYTTYAADDITTHIINCIIQMITCYSYICLFSTNVSTFFCFHYYIEALCDDFRQIFGRIDKKLMPNSSKCQLEVRMPLLDALLLQKTNHQVS